MSLIKFNQKITFWATTGIDENSAVTYAPPITIIGKWTLRDGIMTNAKGEEQKTSFVVLAKVLIPKRSKVFLGVSDSVTPIDGSREIQGNIDNPSITKKYWHTG